MFLFGSPVLADDPAHNWHSHADVARQTMGTFEEMESYRVNFQIRTEDGSNVRNQSGTAYFRKPGHIRFEYSNPAGNLMVSDGQTMWFYISRRNIAGRQDLTLDRQNESGRDIFAAAPGAGLSRLFRRYHYRFDDVEQPRTVDGRSMFILEMDQRVRTGGYEHITLYIDAETYLVYRAIGRDSTGKVTTVTFTDPQVDYPVEGNMFQFEPGSNVRVVHNPLVSDER